MSNSKVTYFVSGTVVIRTGFLPPGDPENFNTVVQASLVTDQKTFRALHEVVVKDQIRKRTTAESARVHIQNFILLPETWEQTKTKEQLAVEANGEGSPCSMPDCNGTMIKRVNTKNNSSFLGCTNYPRCTATRGCTTPKITKESKNDGWTFED